MDRRSLDAWNSLPSRSTLKYAHDQVKSMTFPYFTIGHFTRPIRTFIELLAAWESSLVIDVRTIPRSLTNPQYNCDTLSGSLLDQFWRQSPHRTAGGQGLILFSISFPALQAPFIDAPKPPWGGDGLLPIDPSPGVRFAQQTSHRWQTALLCFKPCRSAAQ
jgi:hypothetical protein